MPWSGIKPATLDQTGNFSVHRMMVQPTEPTRQGFFFFKSTSLYAVLNPPRQGRWENLLGTGRGKVWEEGRSVLLTIIIVLTANAHWFWLSVKHCSKHCVLHFFVNLGYLLHEVALAIILELGNSSFLNSVFWSNESTFKGGTMGSYLLGFEIFLHSFKLLIGNSINR